MKKFNYELTEKTTYNRDKFMMFFIGSSIISLIGIGFFTGLYVASDDMTFIRYIILVGITLSFPAICYLERTAFK